MIPDWIRQVWQAYRFAVDEYGPIRTLAASPAILFAILFLNAVDSLDEELTEADG